MSLPLLPLASLLGLLLPAIPALVPTPLAPRFSPPQEAQVPSPLSSPPVLIAIWDTGTDVEVFPGLLYVNAAERADGKDTDGNGFVDDIHGIAFDAAGLPVPELLAPLWDDPARVAQARRTCQGIEDLRGGFRSPAAAELRALVEERGRAGVVDQIADAARFDFVCHGTHVAGIAVAGNPSARLLLARLSLDDEAVKTVAWAESFVEMCHRSIAYFKDHGVRVVNMSWGWDVHEIEANLADHDVESAPAERRQRAEEIFAVLRVGLHEAIAGAPQIVFVNAAGEAPGDPEAYEWIPGSFELPNLIVVGAVDAAGAFTSFSRHGAYVLLHANGFHVESFVPGGHRMQLSGTSMAAPQVTNVAAHLLVRDPKLEPAEVIRHLVEGGGRSCASIRRVPSRGWIPTESLDCAAAAARRGSTTPSAPLGPRGGRGPG